MNVIEIGAILQDISFLGLHVGLCGLEEKLYLQVTWLDRCARTGDECKQSGRKWYISKHMVRSEIVQTAFKAVLTACEHEVRERFLYRGKPIFGPHFDVDRLVELCEKGGTDERTPRG